MDHYNERRLKLAESTSGSKEKLPEYDSKYKHAKVNYEALLVELKSDLSALDEDIVSFVCPIFANYVTYQNEFLQAVAGSFSTLPGQVFFFFTSCIIFSRCSVLKSMAVQFISISQSLLLLNCQR